MLHQTLRLLRVVPTRAALRPAVRTVANLGNPASALRLRTGIRFATLPITEGDRDPPAPPSLEKQGELRADFSDVGRPESLTEFVSGLHGAPPARTTPTEVTDQRWSELYRQAIHEAHPAFTHHFKYGSGKKEGKLTTVHPHNEFTVGVSEEGGEVIHEKHNIATKVPGSRASSHSAFLKSMGESGPKDVLRVLRGRHLDKGLETEDFDKAKAAVEYAAELGISEGARGGEPALLHAAQSLYLLKHGHLTGEQFADPEVGFVGAGTGGAERLRRVEPLKKHMDLMGKRFEEVQSTKPKWADKTFEEWLLHKYRNKWSGRF